MQIFQVIGLMSGTSLDGVDVALMKTDGENVVERLAFLSVPYGEEIRAQIRACLNKTADEARDAERALTIAHADAVKQLLAEQNLSPSDIDLIGFHGQTIAHAPDEGMTCQIGDGALLAELTGISVINDFRTNDVAMGGQGAPLAPVYHRALLPADQRPAVFLNIGGVANITYVDGNGDLWAFDTGPGNALIDDWMQEKTSKRYDENGALAASGTVDKTVLDKLLSHGYFTRKPPKSLDRNDFVSDVWGHLSDADGAATLTAFSVETIAQSEKFMPEKPRLWIATGGGRHNGFMVEQIKQRVSGDVISIDALGMDGDAIEAEAFAYMAVRAYKNLPISFPNTTGVPQDTVGGKMNLLPADAA